IISEVMPGHRGLHLLALLACVLIPISSSLADSSAVTYVVKDDLNLGEVAVILYGNHLRWKSIAEWNGLKAPYRLEKGQTLKLLEPPTISEGEGEARLLAQWRAYFGLQQSSGQSPMIGAAQESNSSFRARAAAAVAQERLRAEQERAEAERRRLA